MTRSAIAQPVDGALAPSVFRRFVRSRRALITSFVIALLLHVPATPFARIFSGLFHFGDDETEDEGEAIVPIDLVFEEPAPNQTLPKVTPQPEKKATASEPPPPASTGAVPPPPAPTAALPPPPPMPKRESPVDGVQDIKSLSKNPNNVSIILVGSQLRTNPTGAKLGSLLAGNAQWEGFFAGSDIDPVKDIDLMVLTGPQIKISGEVIAIIKFSADIERIKKAINGVVAASKANGEWIDGAPVLAARARADGSERLYALVPEKKLLYIIPSKYPSAGRQKRLEKSGKLEKALKEARAIEDAQLKRVKDGTFTDFTNAEFGVKAYMIEPWKLFGKDGKVELPVVGDVELIPKTLDQATLVVVLQGKEADVTIKLVSLTPLDAVRDAEELTKSWGLVQIGARWKYKLDLPDLKFEAHGKEVSAKTRLAQAALEAAYELGQQKTEEDRKKSRRKEED